MCSNLVPVSFTVPVPAPTIPAVKPLSLHSSNDGPSLGSRVLVHQRTSRVPGTGILGDSVDDENVGIEEVFSCSGFRDGEVDMLEVW